VDSAICDDDDGGGEWMATFFSPESDKLKMVFGEKDLLKRRKKEEVQNKAHKTVDAHSAGNRDRDKVFTLVTK